MSRVAQAIEDDLLVRPELRAGMLVSADVDTRARRPATLDLRVQLADGRRVNVNDLWIAATAAANRLPVVTQDDDFHPLEGAAGVELICV